MHSHSLKRLVEYYRSKGKPGERTARFMERVGFDAIKQDLLSFIPYISLKDL